MSYQDYYPDLKSRSTHIIKRLKKLITLNELENPSEYEIQEKETLSQELISFILSEKNTLRVIINFPLPDVHTVLSNLINKTSQELLDNSFAISRLYYRLIGASNALTSTKLTIEKLAVLGVPKPSNAMLYENLKSHTFTLEETITAYLSINLINRLIPRIKSGQLLGGETITLPPATTNALNTILKDTTLNAIISSPCSELLYALYGNNISEQIISKIKEASINNPAKKQIIDDGFVNFINEINKSLSVNRNMLGEITISDNPQDIMQLLIKLTLLEILIPYMSDNTIRHFAFQFSWGININGEKHSPKALLSTLEQEQNKRGISHSKPRS